MNTLLLTDCMEYMKTCKDNQFDLAIVDPPYGIGISQGNGFYHRKGKGQANPHKKSDWDNTIPKEEYFTELSRISGNQIVWGGNYFTDYLFPTRGWIFWDKLKYVDNYADGELAWTSFDRNTKKYLHQHHGFLNNDGVSIHPTQKPVALYKWLLTNYAKPGDKLFDSHSGSGSFRIAAHDMGFDLDSCELDPDYYRDNEARYQKHIQQIDLFKPEEIQKNIFTEGELF